MARWVAPDGVGIAYETTGDGPAVLLLHGFASSAAVNWVRPGVVAALVDAGYRVVVYDARGHGRSDAPHDPAAYGAGAMVDDAVGLVDHLGIGELAVVGYSMGAQVGAWLAAGEPKVKAAVLGGIGSRLLAAGPGQASASADAIAAALEADDPASIAEPGPRSFRSFADATKADRLALAALQRAGALSDPPDVGALDLPVLLLVGVDDTLVGDVEAMARRLPDARVEVVPGDHLSAVTSPQFAAAVVRFLKERR